MFSGLRVHRKLRRNVGGPEKERADDRVKFNQMQMQLPGVVGSGARQLKASGSSVASSGKQHVANEDGGGV